MRKKLLSMFGTMVVAPFAMLLVASSASGQITAYYSAVQTGNEAWPGNLGLDFNVNTPIVVSSLGAFDSGGAGFVSETSGKSVQVGIFNRSTMLQVGGTLTFTSASPGTLEGGYRFKTLATPIALAAGQYSIVAVGFTGSSLDGDAGVPSPPIVVPTEHSGGAISFVNTGRYDYSASLDFPTNIAPPPVDTNRYLAGTFQFVTRADTFEYETDLNPATLSPPLPGLMFPAAVVAGVFKPESGHTDLAVANTNRGNVTIFFGNGSGTFPTATTVTVGSTPRSLAVGNFINSGPYAKYEDLVVANSGDGTVTFIENKGSGSFATSTITAGTTPQQIAVADFDGDGNLDFAIVNDNAAISVFLGNGDGTFQSPIIDADPSIVPTSLAVADMNGDGIPDLVVTSPVLGAVSVLFGERPSPGMFSFAPAQDLGLILPEPMFVATGNFSGGSNPGLAIADFSGNVYVWVGACTPPAALPPAVSCSGVSTPYPVGMVPSWISVGDINGDGKLDLMVANSYSSDVSVLIGNGTGGFNMNNIVTYGTSQIASMWVPSSIALATFKESKATLDAAITDWDGVVHILLDVEETIAVTSGNVQHASSASATYPMPMVATVSPAVSGIPVTFTALTSSTGASVNFSGGGNTVTVLTNASGKAISPSFMGNGHLGTVTITATVGFAVPTDTTGNTTFTEIN